MLSMYNEDAAEGVLKTKQQNPSHTMHTTYLGYLNRLTWSKSAWGYLNKLECIFPSNYCVLS